MTFGIDPELAAGLSQMPVLDFADISAARVVAGEFEAKAFTEIDRTGIDISEAEVVPSDGGPKVRLLIYTPRAAPRPLPVIYDVHGGGFCLGPTLTEDPRAIELARDVEALVVWPDYRLAPEYPYPAPVEDCYRGLRWVVENADSLGADVGRILIHGQSAGGGIAAALGLLARDNGGPDICFQYLGVPELDDRLETPSMQQYTDTPVWDRGLAEYSWAYYLGEGNLPGSADVPAYAAPARADDLSGLPPTYISVMQFDPLRDEGIDYTRKLLEAGIPVELHLFPGTFHGSSMIDAAEVSRRELDEEVAVLRRALHG